MGRLFRKFRMDWCLIWNSVYDGSIASALHMMISSVVYVFLCLAVIYHGEYYSGPNGITLGNEYREIIRHGEIIFKAGHEEIDGEPAIHTFADARHWLRKKNRDGEIAQTTRVPHWIQKMLLDAQRKVQKDSTEGSEEAEGDGHDTEEPLLTPEMKEKLAFPSYIMLIFSGVNAILSVVLLIAIQKKNVFFLLLWSFFILPVDIIADNSYQIYLFFSLLTMGPLWAHTGTIWFEIFVVANFILWIMRDLFNLYAFFCITAFRNASTQRRKHEERVPMKRRLAITLSGTILAEKDGAMTRYAVDEDEDASSQDESDDSNSGSESEKILPCLNSGQVSSVTVVLIKNGLLRQPSVSTSVERKRVLALLEQQSYFSSKMDSLSHPAPTPQSTRKEENNKMPLKFPMP